MLYLILTVFDAKGVVVGTEAIKCFPHHLGQALEGAILMLGGETVTATRI